MPRVPVEDAWFEVVFIRRNVLKHISGELSHLFCVILQSFFSQDAYNMSTAGIQLLLHDGSHLRILVGFGMMLAEKRRCIRHTKSKEHLV